MSIPAPSPSAATGPAPARSSVPPAVSEVHADPDGGLWGACLELIELRRTGAPRPACCALVRGPSGTWSLEPEPRELEPGAARLVVRTDAEAPADPNAALYCDATFRRGADPLLAVGTLPPSELAFFSLYLPAVFGGWAAADARPFVLGHLAQSIDGRIACENGQSQWISNTANLHHAHRLRALHDGVLVGARTVARDNPRLTVRHVEGASPRRVLLSGSGSVFGLEGRHVFDADGSLVVCAEGTAPEATPDGTEAVCLVPGAGGRIEARRVVECLGDAGLRSLFVEGGGSSLSGFLDDGALDVLHVHIAPIVIGSGVAGFRLPAVDRVGRAPRFATRHFLLDGELLMECRRLSDDEDA